MPKAALWVGLVSATLAAASALAQSDAIQSGRMLDHIRVLSSDEFEGRGVGSAGEAKTVDYLTQHLKAMGLAPGNPDGSYVQKVPMVGSRPCKTPQLLAAPQNWLILDHRKLPGIEIIGAET